MKLKVYYLISTASGERGAELEHICQSKLSPTGRVCIYTSEVSLLNLDQICTDQEEGQLHLKV